MEPTTPPRPREEPSSPSRSPLSVSSDSPSTSNGDSTTAHVSEPTPNTSITSSGTQSSSSQSQGVHPVAPPPPHQYYPPWLRQPPNPDPTYQNAPVLSEYLEANFVPSVVPQPEEYAAKDQARQYLEKLVDQISPGAKLMPFGSMANGFALKNSDVDLCCVLAKDAPVRSPSELVEQLGTLIERETNFYVKMLPRARIPIIKLTMPATPAIPEGMACDIGFENRLALENTRLLLTYAMVDTRVRTLVLFLKVWTKRRKLNSPYRGTLSSYGYVLLVIHFLCHVKQPPVVPNLQRLPLPDSTPLEELTYEGHDISFFDDIDQLSTVFQAQNVESTGELLIDFFKYFANSFDYTKSVISIRSERGTLGKEEKGWNSDIEFDPEMIVRDLHKLCIEDPFALDYNVARTVTKDGLYTIRGEFMRAVRILTTPLPRNTQSADRITAIMNDLCAEREDFLLMHPPPDHHKPHYAPPHQLHSQPQATLQPNLPISKSPRRRSAPSPQLRPAPPHHVAQHPTSSPNQQYGHVPIQGQSQGGHGSVAQAGQTGYVNGGPSTGKGPEETMGLGFGNESSDSAHRNTLGPSMTGNMHPSPQPQPRRQHLQPPSYPRTNPPSTIPPQQYQHQQYHSTAPSSVASSVVGDAPHDRRSSFDSSQERFPGGALNGGDVRAKVPPPSSNGYDLHRFFQNPPSSSMSDAGGPSMPSPHPRTTVSLTAPSSPDLAPAYFANHGYNNNSHYVGRTPYRYPSSNYPSTTNSNSSARHASVPRNPHTSHHAYTNPYATPAPSYPLNSSISNAPTTNGGTATPPYPPYPLNSVGSTSPAPAPIFPAEDRERIARASSITFGNFPELLPLPSYAHYHASGGSAAYLSGSGGWGVNPYGMGGSQQQQQQQGLGSGKLTRRTMAPSGSPYEPGRRGIRRSFGLSGEEDDDVAEEDEGEDESEVVSQFELDVDGIATPELDSRGRTPIPETTLVNGSQHYPTPLEHLSHVMNAPADRNSRQRGRSVPHTRMGPDGRESILFGAIEVTLPKPEDVEAAEREEEEKERETEKERGTRPDEGEEQVGEQEGETFVSTAEEKEEEEAEIANLGPSPPLEDRDSAPTTESISSKTIETIEAIPTFTTSPPTPAKPTPPAPTYAWRPLSPLFNSIPVAPAVEDEDFDLDRTPRPASPSPLPNGPNGLPPASPPRVHSSSSSSACSSASDSPRIVANGLSMLSMTEPSTPSKSKHAAKRARQNERRKAATLPSSPPPLALTSNSIV
ncbi:hypothetical protein JCM16303_002847 [Sporobolomyces ruberrimus]